MKILIFILLLICQFAIANEELCISNSNSIEEKLSCLQDVSFQMTNKTKTTKVFDIRIVQPIDHEDLSLGTFTQKLALIHRGENEPMVLQTSGYSIFGVRDSVISSAFKTNQVQVEHRFFSDSMPSVLDWTKLNIKQSAYDFHNVTVKLKKIYTKNWVNTGASKGGMTSVYHRYFFPDDLNGTVADVAPLSFTRRDQRYIGFIQNVGGTEYQECREKLLTIQIELLKNRDSLIDNFKGDFIRLGSNDVAFEHAVIEMPYYFWQYGDPNNQGNGCPKAIAATSIDEMYQFLNMHAPANYYFDSGINQYASYYFQAATELGGPDNNTSHLEDLRRYEFELSMYTPVGIDLPYKNESMRAVDEWVQSQAKDILFIYGELDPWSAAAFRTGNNQNIKSLWVAGGNHSANFSKLSPTDKQIATDMISGWLGKELPVVNDFQLMDSFFEPSLNDIEFNERRTRGL